MPYSDDWQLSQNAIFLLLFLSMTNKSHLSASISNIIGMEHVRRVNVNVSCCQQRVESGRPDRADGRGQWTGQFWHTSLSATRIHLIINVFQLVANKTQVRGRQAVLSGGRRPGKLGKQHGQNEHSCTYPHAKASFHKKKHTHTHKGDLLPMTRSSALE